MYLALHTACLTLGRILTTWTRNDEENYNKHGMS